MKNLFIYSKNIVKSILCYLINDIKCLNMQKNLLEFREQKLLLKSLPFNYTIGLTNVCNLKCPLCVTGLRKQKKDLKFMDFELFKQIIDKIKDYAKLIQLYKWGESLLHRDIIKMFEYCNRYNLNTEISSNLSLDNIDDTLEAMVKYRLKRLIVSFDGVNQDDYSRYRKGGNFSLVLDNINKIYQYKMKYNTKYPKIILQYLRSKYTNDQIEIIQKNYKKWNADEYIVFDMTTIFKDRDLEKAKEWFTMEEIGRRKYLDLDLSMHGKVCSFLYSTMIIEQDGSIPPCCFTTDPFDDFDKWDNDKTIVQMYNSSKWVNARRMFKEKTFSDNIACNGCTALITFRKIL